MTDVHYELVDTEDRWQPCLAALRRAPRMAVDIEANSLYAYWEQICLIQISVENHNFIIDPLCGISLQALQDIFADPRVEKIFHAAEYDLVLMKSLYGWTMENLFDTMWAGRLLGFSKMGLAWFLENLYGVKLNKKHQKANWAQRPLSKEKLIYACNDTCHLLKMRDELGRQLAEKGLEEEAREVFRDLCNVHTINRKFDPDGFWKLPGVRAMPPRAQAVLKALYAFRDGAARHRDVPPFKVINNQMLLQLAQVAASWNGRPPEQLGQVPGVPDKILERLNPRLFRVICGALKDPAPKYPVRTQSHSPGYWQRYELLMQWRKEVAARRGVESDVVLGRSVMEAIAENPPRSEQDLEKIVAMGTWRRSQYGATILKLLNQ